MQEVWHLTASRRVRLIALLFLTIVEFAREPPHGLGRLYHQPLRSGYFILELECVKMLKLSVLCLIWRPGRAATGSTLWHQRVERHQAA